MSTETSALTEARARARISLRTAALVVAGGAWVLLWGLPTIIIPLATDQMLFMLGARTVLDGGQLYADFWEIKGPLIFLIYAIPGALVGDHMEAIRVLDLVNTGLATAGAFLVTRRFFGERAGVIAGAAYAFAYLTWSGLDGLAESESFMAAPLLFALLVYRPADGGPGVAYRALASGVLLGVAFGLKSTAVLFVVALPLLEYLFRREEPWSPQGAAVRLAVAGAGFIFVQMAQVVYLAAGGALGDFIDIQRNYTAPYNAYRWGGPEGSHARFLLTGTADWVRTTSFLIVPALGALLFALRDGGRRARGAWLFGVLALLAAGSVWWQGKMFHYHWIIALPLLAPLTGYAVDRLLSVFDAAALRERAGAWALLGAGFVALAFVPLLDTYDGYRLLVDYAQGDVSRRQVEASYQPLFQRNHQLVDYIKANGDEDDRLFIWGLWPVAYHWLDRPLHNRFVANHGLRATWAPEEWRQELMEALTADPPRWLAVARGDNQPWLVGTTQTSDEFIREDFPALQRFLDERYRPVQDFDLFVLYELRPAAVRGDWPAAGGRDVEGSSEG